MISSMVRSKLHGERELMTLLDELLSRLSRKNDEARRRVPSVLSHRIVAATVSSSGIVIDQDSEAAGIRICLQLDSDTSAIVDALPDNPPYWTGADFHQCRNCPLQVGESPHCPAALRLAAVGSTLRQSRVRSTVSA